MRPTDDLREEHRAIKLMLRILEGICEDIEFGRSFRQEYLEKLVEFMRGFVDRCHHTKEETYLFPEMEKAGISGSRELITSLKREHEQGRQLVNKIEDAVSKKEYRKLPSVLDNSRAYIHLLIPHIDKEENDLFPLADVYLLQAVQNKLLEFFEVVETEIGPGKHEEYHNWLHIMGEIYINPE